MSTSAFERGGFRTVIVSLLLHYLLDRQLGIVTLVELTVDIHGISTVHSDRCRIADVQVFIDPKFVDRYRVRGGPFVVEQDFIADLCL